jgi:thiazole synthase/sulfur carrier protein
VSIKVNSKQVDWVENETVQDLLKRMRYTFPLVVVKINDKVIPRKEFLDVKIPDNSKVAVIHMISGG